MRHPYALTWSLIGLLLACGLPSGCGPIEEGPPGEDEDYEAVEPGKEDNFRGLTSQEFAAEAEATVTLDSSLASASESGRLERARELVSAKLLQIGWFLNLWVCDKEPEDANRSYGGFHAMARNASVKALKIIPRGGLTYAFNFEATIAGDSNLLKLMPGKAQSDGSKLCELQMAKLSNQVLLGSGWQSSYGVHDWSPARLDPSKLERLSLRVRAVTQSANAYLPYAALLADGKLTVGAQFGWDYNKERIDLRGARQLYQDLVQRGFTSPVSRFEDLKLSSPPLTRTASVFGKKAQVEVRLVHAGMVASPSGNARELRQALLDMLATREVVLFAGHAGVSGRLLPADFWSTSAGNIAPEELAKVRLLSGFQLMLIGGCQTYARFTDALRANPAKRGPDGELRNMDVVTTAGYIILNRAHQIMEGLLFPLIGTDASQPVQPSTWDDVLRAVNRSPNQLSFFGVNGIDNDPHGHPYARRDLLGRSCSAVKDCGGDGNLCLRPKQSSSAKVCATVCLDDAGCPSGYRCSAVQSGGQLASRGCTKR